jgi:hypothetical protein
MIIVSIRDNFIGIINARVPSQDQQTRGLALVGAVYKHLKTTAATTATSGFRGTAVPSAIHCK